jgi:hypothetical protein
LQLRTNAPIGADAWSTSGRTIRWLSEITGRAANIIFVGQSTNQNNIDSTTSVSHGSHLFNLSLAHRSATQIYQAKEPLLVSDLNTGGHHGMSIGDMLVDQGTLDNVVLTNIACGGSYCADWAPGGGTVGGTYAGSRAGVLAYRIEMVAQLIEKAGLSHLPTIIDWQQGEWDSDATNTSQSNYAAALNSVINEFKRVGLLRAGNVMFVHLCTRPSASSGAKTAIRAAQASVVDGNLVRAGADIDALGGAYRYDGTHFNASGAAAQAALKVPLYQAFLS